MDRGGFIFRTERSSGFCCNAYSKQLYKELQFNALLPDETSNASSLYDLLAGYDVHIFSGHTHYNWNVVFNDKLMEHNTAAVCGTFWKADICTDGTPAATEFMK